MNNTSLYNALTTKTIQTRSESVSKSLNTEAAMDVRDALVKGVYGRMFIWLIDKINLAIYRVNRDPRHVRKSIGVLDIFGFENFDFNRWVLGSEDHTLHIYYAANLMGILVLLLNNQKW